MTNIRPFEENDWIATWGILEPVFRAGATYAYSPDITEDEAYDVWIEMPSGTFVAVNEHDDLLGTYYIKPNQPGLGSHVCNAGYMVASKARGKGIGRAMCRHSLDEARKLGFKAMQYNLVVCTNKGAIKLWQDLGFKIIGTLPKAFNHKEKGYVNALVMYQWLA